MYSQSLTGNKLISNNAAMFKESAETTEAVEQQKAAMESASQLFVRNLSFDVTTEV